jgi:hypothetical protein
MYDAQSTFHFALSATVSFSIQTGANFQLPFGEYNAHFNNLTSMV